MICPNSAGSTLSLLGITEIIFHMSESIKTFTTVSRLSEGEGVIITSTRHLTNNGAWECWANWLWFIVLLKSNGKGPLLHCQSVGNTGQNSSQFLTCTRGHYLLLILMYPLKTMYWGVKYQLQKNYCENRDHQTFFCLTQASLFEWMMLNRDARGHEALRWDIGCHKIELLLHALNPVTCPRASAPPEVMACNDEPGLWFVRGEKSLSKEREARGQKKPHHSFVNSDSRVEWVTAFITLCQPFSISNLL